MNGGKYVWMIGGFQKKKRKKEGKKNLVDDVDLSFCHIPLGPKSVRHNRSLHLAGNVKEFMNQQLTLMLLTFFSSATSSSRHPLSIR